MIPPSGFYLEDITFDELALIAPTGSNTVLFRGSREESATIRNSINGKQLMIPS